MFDQQRDAGSVVVEAPQVERLQRQIGDQDLIVILAELEERQLVGRLLGLEPGPDRHWSLAQSLLMKRSRTAPF